MPGLWRGEQGGSCRHEPSAGVSWRTSHARPGSPHEGCEAGQPLSGRRAAPLPPAPCQHGPGSGAEPPPPAGRARRSAGRRPGRVVSCRAQPRRVEPPGPAVTHRPGPGHHFPPSTGAILAARSCGATGAAPQAPRRGGRYVLPGEGRAGGRAGRDAAFPGCRPVPPRRAARARSGSPQPSEGDLGEKGNFW